MVERLRDAVKLVTIELGVDLARRFVQPRKNPAIVQRQAGALAGERIRDRLGAFSIQQAKARGVPNLVGKVSIRFNLALATPYLSNTSSGSIPLPFVFDMRWPCLSRTVPVT